MARRPNYGFEKRQRELRKQKKKEKKLQKKLLKKERAASNTPDESQPDNEDQGG